MRLTFAASGSVGTLLTSERRILLNLRKSELAQF